MNKSETNEKTEFSIIFPKRLRKIRQERKITQTEIATKIGISANALNNYENGKRVPSADTLQKIAICLNVSADYLLGLSDDTEAGTPVSDVSFEDIANAVITLSALINVDFMGSELIKIKDKNLQKFIEEFLKIMDFIKSPKYPDYLKDSLKNALVQNFSGKYCIIDGVITLTPEHIGAVFGDETDELKKSVKSFDDLLDF